MSLIKRSIYYQQIRVEIFICNVFFVYEFFRFFFLLKGCATQQIKIVKEKIKKSSEKIFNKNKLNSRHGRSCELLIFVYHTSVTQNNVE